MKNIHVFFDQQENQYYRINKQTGETTPAHKNGHLFAQFKAEYSGSNYQLRKEREKDLSPPSIIKAPFKIKSLPKHSSANHSNHSKEYFSSASKISNDNILVPAQSDPLSRCATIDSSTEFKCSRFHESKFSQRLAEFVKMNQNKVSENNSPLKQYQGSLPFHKLLSQYDNKILKGLQFSKQKKLKRLKNIHNLPQFLAGKRQQLLKERQIFYKNHPNVPIVDNPRQIREIKQRKRNLKILQKISIQQNNKVTQNIYE